MHQATEQALFEGMAAEAARDKAPPGFPSLPMIPGARYTDLDFLALEDRWRTSWLYALHADELPRPGSCRLWRCTGSPIIIVRGRDDRIRHVHSASFEVACNVKVLLDAFLETHHLKSIHPQTVDRFLESRGTFHLLWDNGNSLMVTPHRREDWEDPGAVGMPGVETAPQIFAEQNASYNLYPNLITPISATGIPFLTFWPNGPRDMIVDVHWFAPEGAHGHELWPTRIANFVRILEEDTQFAPQIQESVESGGFRGMYLSYQERRIYHWHETLDQRIGLENIPEPLRVQPMLGDWVSAA